jgi:predicted enzyme related to lactoylglutathione lyase
MEGAALAWPIWIGVVVNDLERQRRFWGDMLGLPEDHSGDNFVSFKMADGRWFELIERSEDPEYDAIRFQVAFEVDDIESAYRRTLTAGGRSHHRGAEPEPWAYFRDPEGNVFAIKQRSASASLDA